MKLCGLILLLRFFFRFALVTLVPVAFRVNLRMMLSISTKKSGGDVGRSWVPPRATLGKVDVLAVLSLAVRGQSVSLHFFRCALISFTEVLWVSAYKSCTCFLDLYLPYFIFF